MDRRELQNIATSLPQAEMQIGSSGILLTGATGMLGANVLARMPRAEPIFCLVRADSEAMAWTRLKEAAIKHRVPWEQENVVPILSIKGVSARAIWHMAAATNVFSSFQTLFESNVKLTRVLAGHPNCTIASSLSVFTATDMTPHVCYPTRLNKNCGVVGGYPQSKTAAEYAAPKATVVRYSLIVGQETQRHVKTIFDEAMKKVGYAPRPRFPKMAVDMVSVEKAARRFIEVAGSGSVYHCSSELPVSVADYVRGYPLVSDCVFEEKIAALSRLEQRLIRHSFYGTPCPLELFEGGRGWEFKNT